MDNSNNWYAELFKIKDFRSEVIRIYNTEIKNILYSINIQTDANMGQSAKMNNIVWDTLGKISQFGRLNKATYEEECNYLKSWIENRVDYLDSRYSEDSDIYNIRYRTHVQDYGWEDYDSIDGELSGTEGESKRLEAIRIDFDTFNSQLFNDIKVKYQVHVQDLGWMDWKNEGELAGTIGEAKRIEAIRIKLDDIEGYSIKYRVHVQDMGWQNWKKNGELAGTEGQSKRIEAIEIVVEKSNDTENQVNINYSTHIQDKGWSDNKENGQIAGTEGESKRLEAIKINLINNTENIRLIYRTHIQDIGWQDWKENGEVAGTEGEAKRLEAIEIKLENTSNYKVRYRVHVQNIGWQDWKENGEVAGTSGQSLRIEAIQIQLVEE